MAIVLVPGVSVTLVNVDVATSNGTVPLTKPEVAEMLVVPAVRAVATPMGDVLLIVATPMSLLPQVTYGVTTCVVASL